MFRRPTGVPHEFLNQLDVRAAVERIQDGHHDLARLASELGSSGHGRLSANFRRAFGVPPSLVRRART